MNLGERYRNLRASVKDESGNPISVKDFAAKCVKLQAPRISELENNKREMSLTELKAYHEYFKVSFEYLLGETDVETVDDKVQAAIEVTGLSEEAVNKLTDYNKSKIHDCSNNILSHIIESDSFFDLMFHLYSLIEYKNIQKYLKETEGIFAAIGANYNFSFEIRRDFFSKITNYFQLTHASKSLVFSNKIQKLYFSAITATESSVKNLFSNLIDSCMIDAQNAVEWIEFQTTKRYQKSTEDVLLKSTNDYSAYKKDSNQDIISWYTKERTYGFTDEEQRFGEYIRNLFEKEAENNGKFNPPKE